MRKITKELQKSGIYCIINLYNNKCYVGSSKNVYQRLSKHRSLLRKNKHNNKILQNSWNKYKEDNFDYQILEFCNEDVLEKKEQYYIDNYNSDLNITKIVERNILSKESRKLQSETRIKKIASGEIKLWGKEIYQYDLDGNFIRKFDTIKEACLKNNIHQSTICRFLNGTYKKGGGYLWSLTYEEKLKPYIKSKRNLNKLCKQVEVLDYYSLKVIYSFNSLKECAKFFKCFPSSISNAIKVKQKFKQKYMITIKTA